MHLPRLGLLINFMLLIIALPVRSLDSVNDSPPTANARENRLLQGSVNKLEQGKAGSTNQSGLRVEKPISSLNGEAPLRANTAVHSSSVPILDINQSGLPVKPDKAANQNNQQGAVGLLGMYVLCAVDPNSPSYITNVFPPSLLNQTGVQTGDLLIQINGTSTFNYLHTAHPIKPGATIQLKIEHQGETKTVSAKLSDMRTFVPFLGAYGQWMKENASFLKEHHDQYRGCGLL